MHYEIGLTILLYNYSLQSRYTPDHNLPGIYDRRIGLLVLRRLLCAVIDSIMELLTYYQQALSCLDRLDLIPQWGAKTQSYAACSPVDLSRWERQNDERRWSFFVRDDRAVPTVNWCGVKLRFHGTVFRIASS